MRQSIIGVAALVAAGLTGATSSLSTTLRAMEVPAEGRVAAERANRAMPTVRDNLQQGKRSAEPQTLKRYFRGGGPAGWRGWKYPGAPTTVAAEKRKARKRRNQLRHKGKRA